jgi:hypothetical protein
MSIVPLTYLRKRYKVVPFTNHTKMTGGQMTRIDTFLTCYGTDAELVLAYDNKPTPAIVKIMLNDPFGRAEVRIQQFFKQTPHRNIVKCMFSLNTGECPINWNIGNTNINHVRCWYCDIDTYIVIVQDYIKCGDLFSNIDRLNYPQWKSIFLQTLFAVLELFDKYGFNYDNWKLSNIVLDDTVDTIVVYKAFDIEWIVADTHGISPVFTDLSKSGFDERKLEYLLESISLCVEMYGKICKNITVEKYCNQFSNKIKENNILNKSIDSINEFILELNKY